VGGTGDRGAGAEPAGRAGPGRGGNRRRPGSRPGGGAGGPIALTDDRGRLLWVSAARPGRTSEITACRHDQLAAGLRAAGLGAIADLGFVGLDGSGPDADPAVITGYKAAQSRPLTRGQKLSNKALAAVRAPVEHGFAHLKNWRVLGKVRTDPKWATTLVRALLVLTNREVSR
jgi:hypothetical protein